MENCHSSGSRCFEYGFDEAGVEEARPLFQMSPPPSSPVLTLQSRLQAGIVILEVSRNPTSLFQALEGAAHLQQVHNALGQAGLETKLASGASVWVSVDQYRAVAMVAECLQLARRHLVLSQNLEQMVETIVGSLPSRDNVRIKSAKYFSGLELYTKEQDMKAEIDGTFVSVDLPSSMRSRPRGPATCSTTDGHLGRGRNPRRA